MIKKITICISILIFLNSCTSLKDVKSQDQQNNYPVMESGSYDGTKYISTGSETDVTLIKSFWGENGENVLLMFVDGTETVTGIVHGETGNNLISQNDTFGEALPNQARDISTLDLEGEYKTLVSNGSKVQLGIDSDGNILSLGNASVQVSGKCSDTSIYGIVNVVLTLSDAGTQSGDYEGIIYSDPLEYPVQVHMVLINNATEELLDLLIFNN